MGPGLPGNEAQVRLLYLAANRRQRLSRSRIGCVLAMALTAVGAVLDIHAYPERVDSLLHARLWTLAGLAAVLVPLLTPLGARLVRVLGLAWPLVFGGGLAWLVLLTDGVSSPYVAGLGLLMLAAALLIPWTALEALAVCGGAVVMYALACVGVASESTGLSIGPVLAATGDAMVIHGFFLLLMVAVCTGATWMLDGLRLREFVLRHELADRNEKLDESYRKLSGLDKLKTQFFSNVSHELRTPLTLIISPLDALLQRGGTGVKATDDMIAIARDNGLRLLRLTNQMLDLVKFDEKAARIHPRNEDVGHLVAGVISSAGHLARAKGVELVVAPPPDPALVVHVDAAAFEKVLLNLFTNAVKFTPAGGSISVSVEKSGANALVRVKDTGIGIAPGDLERVFDRFAQLDESGTRKYSGIGIGLALARQLVNAHGGTLTAASEPGKGTTMTASLPLAPGPVDAAAAPAPDAISEIHARSARSVAIPGAGKAPSITGAAGELLLVIEDEPDMSQFIVDLLADRYRVARAFDGTSGLEHAQRLKPALVLLDVMLPGMDGLEVCRRIRNSAGLESTRVVLLTARSDEEAKLVALQNGAHDFLTKPFSSLELQTRVANLLRSARLEDELRDANRELSQALKTLRETEAQLIQSEKINALGTLAAGLLHEILNPLNFTLAAVQMALMNTPPEQGELHEMLADIENGMKRIRDIVGDLRTFAHPEVHLRTAPFRFRDAVDAARRITGPELVNFRFVEDVPESIIINGSEGQVVQLLVNLFTNAARATRNRKDAELKVSAAQANGTVTLRVRDNGVGIAPEKLAKVFDPFYTTQEPGQGMGLGLTICQTIVRNHGGKIQIESMQGDWTEVVVDLPSTMDTGEKHAHTAGLS